MPQRFGSLDLALGKSGGIVAWSQPQYLVGTIEQDTYLALLDRIGVFENVVGPLQPILAQMPRIFRKLGSASAMACSRSGQQKSRLKFLDRICRLNCDELSILAEPPTPRKTTSESESCVGEAHPTAFVAGFWIQTSDSSSKAVACLGTAACVSTGQNLCISLIKPLIG